ncbi:hypothetical protein UFOVP71_317 [uncultured Caudovirales phage]|uniref:Uncharacterized protein n=1 Tax=uncultured Caudovirales phage TaxID=2100421 RepID=A0A6J5TBW7_9CAUD|nr:hypothetical protein UFOVP71_317 [uncultured Caudovirales phage]
MAVIPVLTDKPTELNAQLTLFKERNIQLEARFERLEKRFDDFEEHSRQTKRVIIGSLISIATGVFTTIVAIFLRK